MYKKHLHLIESIKMGIIAHRFGYETTITTFDIGFKDYNGGFEIPTIKELIKNNFINNIFDNFDYDTKKLLTDSFLNKTRRIIFKVSLWCGVSETFRYDISDKDEHLSLNINVMRDINRWIKKIKVENKATLTLKFFNSNDVVKDFKLDHDNGYITLGDKYRLFKFIRKNIKEGDNIKEIHCVCSITAIKDRFKNSLSYSLKEEVASYDVTTEKGLCHFIDSFINQLYCQKYYLISSTKYEEERNNCTIA